MSFTHLRAHSSHSLLDGAFTPAGLAKAVKAAGMDSCALTDTGNLCGVVEWMEAAQKAGVRPLYGAYSWLEPMSRELGPNGDPLDEGSAVLLLVEDARGYENLCTLISDAIRNLWFRPRTTLEDLIERADGLTCILPMDHGPLFHPQGRAVLDAVHGAFGERLAFEVFDHGLGWEESRIERVRALGKTQGVPVVATNAVRYLRPHEAPNLDVLRAVARKIIVDREERARTDQAYLTSEAEMRERLGDEACEATRRVAERCRWAPSLGTYHFPKSDPPAELEEEARWAWLYGWFPPPEPFGVRGCPPYPSELPSGEKESPLLAAYFAWYAREGLRVRLEKNPSLDKVAYRDRLDREVEMIQEMGFCAYMLIVAEFINWAKDAGVAVGPGRGSVAGSIVAWTMRLTEVDSLKFTLYFERFLNVSRCTMPDVDVDFSKARREEVITHMRERYGDAHVGQIANFGAYGPKSAFKDVSRVLRVGFDDANRWSAWIGEKTETIHEAFESEPKFTIRAQNDPVLARVKTLATALCGDPPPPPPGTKSKAKSDPLLRQRGVHAAGVVVTPLPLVHYAPLHLDADTGRQVLGTDMHGVDVLGLIKYDFLGLKTLDVIEEALDTVQERTGARPDLDQIPLDDQAVFKLLCNGDVLGVFQVESSGMEGLIRRLKPDTIEEIIALLALYRPGPLQSGMVDNFVERKHGRQAIEEMHPSVTETLKPTFGVIVFQEQAMKIAQELSGYSLAEADILRRCIGKKKPDEMAAQKDRFISGATARGVPTETSSRIFDVIEGFASYSFNKAHSAAYGLITYRTAWLKTHHRAAFLAAACTWEADDHEKLSVYLMNARRTGLRVLPPDLRYSKDRFTVEDDPDVPGKEAIRFGLRALKNVGEAALPSLLALKDLPGALASLDALWPHIDHRVVNKTIWSRLVCAGTLDFLGMEREDLLREIEVRQEDHRKMTTRLKADARRAAEGKPVRVKKEAPAQTALFGATVPVKSTKTEKAKDEKENEAPRPWSPVEKLEREVAVTGVYLSGHPLDRYADIEASLRTVTLSTLADTPAREPIEALGCVGKVHRLKTRAGHWMTFVALHDRTSLHEATMFPALYERRKDLLTPGRCVRIRGRLDRDGAEGKLILEDMEDLGVLRRERTRVVRLTNPGGWPESRRKACLELLRAFPGRCVVVADQVLDVPTLPTPLPEAAEGALAATALERRAWNLPAWQEEEVLGLCRLVVEHRGGPLERKARERYTHLREAHAEQERMLPIVRRVEDPFRVALGQLRVDPDEALFDRADRVLGRGAVRATL